MDWKETKKLAEDAGLTVAYLFGTTCEIFKEREKKD
jgi:hypothetical protein